MFAKSKISSRNLVLTVMIVSAFITAISQSMLTAVLSVIIQEFRIDATLGQLLTVCYIFTLGLVAALSASLIKRFNTRHLYIISMAFFIVGCAIDYFAQNYAMLLFARIIEASGAGILLPLMQVVLLNIYPNDQYGRAMGLTGLVFGFVPVIGPILSGAITDLIGWRDIFSILGCLAAVALLVSLFVVKDVGAHKKEALDVPSLLLYSLGLVGFMAGITLLEQLGFSWSAAIPTIVGIALIVIFIVRQLRIKNPYLQISLFKNRQYAIGTALLAIAQIVMISSAIQVPLYLQGIHGLSATESALVLMPGALCLPILSPITGRIFDRIGGRRVGLIGFGCMIISLVAFMFFTATTPYWLITGTYLVRMAGITFALMPMSAYSMVEIEKPDIPQATAIQNSFRQIAGSAGSSAVIALATIFAASTTSAGMDLQGFDASLIAQTILIAAAFTLTLAFVKK